MGSYCCCSGTCSMGQLEVVGSADVPRANAGRGQALFRLPYRQSGVVSCLDRHSLTSASSLPASFL